MISEKQDLSDQEIIPRILNGEKDLYELIIRKYNQRLYRIGIAILKEDEEVEDAMQTTYIRAYEHLEQFAYKSSFSTWLTRILINDCLLRLKAKKRFAQTDKPIEEFIFASGMKNPLQKVLNEELKLALEEAVLQLPEKYRLVFVMREIESISVAETMTCLGLSESNVKVRLNRAKTILREKLTDFYKSSNVLEFHLSKCNRMVEHVFRNIKRY